MRWIIKNPAPSDSRRHKWGDFHFGRSLTKYLERSGHEVITHYDPGWDEDLEADIVIVLRGKYPFPPEVSHGGALRILWNISHPDDVSIEECATYDLVLVASRPRERELRERLDRPVHAMLQCTDLEEFFPTADTEPRRDFVFIGNTREVERPGVLWALDYGLPLQIWGRGWSKYGVPTERIVADYFPNEQLGGLYSRSRATINDHWGDMKRYGYVNNRIFDALACELPVISDWHEELESLVPGGILFYRDRTDFDRCVERVLLDYPTVQAGAREGAEVVRERFSFEDRVEELERLASHHLERSASKG